MGTIQAFNQHEAELLIHGQIVKNDAASARLLYVALSRATDHLVMTVAGDTPHASIP